MWWEGILSCSYSLKSESNKDKFEHQIIMQQDQQQYIDDDAGSIWNFRLLGLKWFGGSIFSLTIFRHSIDLWILPRYYHAENDDFP